MLTKLDDKEFLNNDYSDFVNIYKELETLFNPIMSKAYSSAMPQGQEGAMPGGMPGGMPEQDQGPTVEEVD